MPDLIANIDYLTQSQGMGAVGAGEVASLIMANGRFNPGAKRPFWDFDEQKRRWSPFQTAYVGGDPKSPTSYRTIPVTNATLRRDEWKQLDDALVMVKDYRLGGVDDLISAGLTYNLGNGMGTTVLEWHDMSDALTAELSMDGVTRGQNDRPTFNTHYLPIPIIHVDYEINMRELATSRNMGNPLDTTLAERAARRVKEKIETMLFTNTTYGYGGGTIYSYVNYPHRNQVTFENGAWNTLTANSDGSVGEQIVIDVLKLKKALIAKRFYGPYKIYLPSNFETILDQDYDTTTPGTTIRERIMKIEGISGISINDSLTDSNVLMVQMSNDVVRLVNGMGLTNVEWMTEGNTVAKFKVMAIQVPQIRSDSGNRTGIAHLAA